MIELAKVQHFPAPVTQVAAYYGEPCNEDPDNCECKGIECMSPECPRWWAIFFSLYKYDELLRMVSQDRGLEPVEE